jgi:type II secretory pathway pseudopilin PulG
MFKFNKQKIKAFTLIELLLYIGLVSIFVVVISSFWGFFDQAKKKSTTIEEVNQQGLYLNELISQAIRDGSTIASPSATNSDVILLINTTKQPTRNQIRFELLAGKMYMTEGAGTAVQISSDRVIISALSFLNASQTTTNGNIKFQFTVNHINPNGRSEYNFIQTFYGSATTR